ncbi:hypothetical protein ACFLZP_02530 [Patescibacteria group bacterium]
MSAPAVFCHGSIYEPLWSGVKVSADSPSLIVAKIGPEGTKILSMEGNRWKGISSEAQSLPDKAEIDLRPGLPEGFDANPAIKNWMTSAICQGRYLPPLVEAVMQISCDDMRINARRSRVACGLWQIQAQMASLNDQSLPRLIANGYAHEVTQTLEIAEGFGVPAKLCQGVILPPKSSTVSHAPKMIEQISNLPQSIAFVTSTYHLLRTWRCLRDGFRERQVSLYPFESPTPTEGTAELYQHEAEQLWTFRKGELLGNPMSIIDPEPSPFLWARQMAGWDLFSP